MNRVLICLVAVAGLSSCSQRSDVVTLETTSSTSKVTTGSGAEETTGSSTTVVDKAREQEASAMALRMATGLDYSLRSQAGGGLTAVELYSTDMRKGAFADLLLKNKQEFGMIKISAVGPKGERYVLWENAPTGVEVGAETPVWAYEVTAGGASVCAWIGENASMPAVVQTGAC